MKSRLPDTHPMGRSPIARNVHRILLGLTALLSGLLLPFMSRAAPFHVNLITRIDLDANGTTDFEYRGGQAVNSAGCQSWPGSTVTGYGLFGLNGNQILRISTGCYPLMAIPDAGTTENDSPVPPLHWGPMAELLVNDFSGITGPYFFGPFHSSTQGYAAVRFASPAGLHYGWIRFTNAAPDLQPAVADFSFNPTVSTPLEIGRVIHGQGVFSTNEIRIPGSTTVLGRVRHEFITNAVWFWIKDAHRWRVHLELSENTLCLGRSHGTNPLSPAILEERRLLSDFLPGDATLKPSADPILLMERVEIWGRMFSATGPLALRDRAVFALGNSSGDHWWIEFLDNGEHRFIGHSHPSQGPLIVGQPSMHPRTPASAIDIDGDRRMDFSYQVVAERTPEESHQLHPFREHRILLPLNVPRGGSLIGASPPEGSWWTNAPVTLWNKTGLADPVVRGTNGYVALEFRTAGITRRGWIRLNSYIVIHGVSGFQTLFTPFLDFLDYGADPAEQPLMQVGRGSASPRLRIEDGRAHLSWHPFRFRASLEWSPTMDANTWTTLTHGDGSSHVMTLPDTNAPGFFRLRPPEAKPPSL